MKTNYHTIIIGGGPAGMMAAITAAKTDDSVCLLEKTNQLGTKLLMTGNGRCNLTNNTNVEQFIDQFTTNGKFLYSSLYSFSPFLLMNFFTNHGVDLKTERGNRVFPKSNKAREVQQTLIQILKQNKIIVMVNQQVIKLNYHKKEQIFTLKTHKNQIFNCHKVIIATGGMSYPKTGSNGDGYKLATHLGHNIIKPKPALCPLFVKNQQIRNLAGLTLKNIEFKVTKNKKVLKQFFGELLFTHQGITGPAAYDCSTIVYNHLSKQNIFAHIDLKPALSKQTLLNRLKREKKQLIRKEYQTLLKNLLPKSLIPLAIEKTQIDQHRKVKTLHEPEWLKLIYFLKNFYFKIDGVAPIEYAIVTNGGVDVKQINPQTLESKLIPGLFFAGEVLDIDGPTGGYNLQAAFSTGYLAGLN